MSVAARRRGEIMRPARQRDSQTVRTEAPIGGWNTRDSVDNVPPTDALRMDNWVPDIGEVRTRPGYTEHVWLGDVTTGSQLVLNPGFESAGGGGADVFANWVETANNSTIFQDSAQYRSGSYSAAISRPIGGSTQGVITQTIAVSASTLYKLEIWALNGGASPTIAWPQYAVYDVSNAAYITEKTDIELEKDDLSFELMRATFETPVGCVSLRIEIYSSPTTPLEGDNHEGNVRIDDVSLYELVAAPDQVETLAPYSAGTNTKMVAAMNNHLFDVTIAGSPSDITGAATITMDRWQTANFDGKLGLVNGTDTPLQWAGSGNVSTMTLTGSGLTPANVIGINTYKNRSWFWEDGSQDVWYSALSTLGGALTKFPLSRVGQFGGNLLTMITWTRDGGSGPDDFAVFVMTSGEAIVYQGSSPSVGGDWSLVGIYNIGKPLGVRAYTKFGGDVFIATQLDYVNLADILAGVEARTMKSKISGALRDALNSNWGWDAIIYPKGRLAIFNVPVTTGTTYQQHVMNTVTGAWCRFTGILSNCWEVFEGEAYFGGANGYVYHFDIGDNDADTAIESNLQTAWMPLGSFTNKTFNAMREFYKANATVGVTNTFATDYRAFNEDSYPTAVDSTTASWGDPWGTPWSAGDSIYSDWEMIGAYGEVIAMRKYLSTKQQVTYYGVSWVYSMGQRL